MKGIKLKQARERAGIKQKEVALAVKAVYPRFDTTLLSKAEAPHLYGVALLPEAMNMIVTRWPTLFQPVKRPRSEKRKLPNRVTCRLSNEEYRRLQAACTALGQTIQDYVRDAILFKQSAMEENPQKEKCPGSSNFQRHQGYKSTNNIPCFEPFMQDEEGIPMVAPISQSTGIATIQKGVYR